MTHYRIFLINLTILCVSCVSHAPIQLADCWEELDSIYLSVSSVPRNGDFIGEAYSTCLFTKLKTKLNRDSVKVVRYETGNRRNTIDTLYFGKTSISIDQLLAENNWDFIQARFPGPGGPQQEKKISFYAIWQGLEPLEPDTPYNISFDIIEASGLYTLSITKYSKSEDAAKLQYFSTKGIVPLVESYTPGMPSRGIESQLKFKQLLDKFTWISSPKFSYEGVISTFAFADKQLPNDWTNFSDERKRNFFAATLNDLIPSLSVLSVTSYENQPTQIFLEFRKPEMDDFLVLELEVVNHRWLVPLLAADRDFLYPIDGRVPTLITRAIKRYKKMGLLATE